MSGESGKIAGTVRGPIGVIALLIGICETLVTVAAIKTDGWIQGLYAGFSVLFATGVAVSFFRILKRNPLILIPPESYTQYATLNDLAEAMHKYSEYSQITLSRATRISAETGVRLAWPKEMPVRNNEIKDAIEKTIKVTEERVAQSSVTVDISRMASIPDGGRTTIFLPVDDETTVSTFLNQLYIQISPHVRAYTYGEKWILEDADTGRQLRYMGGLWAREHLGSLFDPRLLSDFGIVAGTRLAAVRLPAS
jgi:hypothetical protein